MPDITETLKADSTQLNAVEFGGSHLTFTIASVRVVAGDQPVNILLLEDPREYRPSKSMRRVLAACLGPDSDTWTGTRFTLYNDPSVKWGGKEIGGIKISHISGIDKPISVMLQESSTVRKPHRVQPLLEAAEDPSPRGPTHAQIAATTDAEALKAAWGSVDPERQALIVARVAELTGGAS